MGVMGMERERLKLSQDMDMVDMVDTDMEDPMEAMVDTEAMVVMDMERERLKPKLSQDTDMEDMVMEREMLSQVMVMVVMDMEDLMEVMVDTEAMAIEVMVMESNKQTFINQNTID